LRRLLRNSGEAVLASELVRVELARAAMSAVRARRISDVGSVLLRIEADLGGLIGLLELEPSTVLPCARQLVLEHRLGMLDAIHLAVAVEERRRSPDPVVFVTRDADQAAAATALGFPLL
jgi:predicted nucleic acid-binding protein